MNTKKKTIILAMMFFLISCNNNSQSKIKRMNFKQVNSIFSIDKVGTRLPFIIYDNKIILVESKSSKVKIYNFSGKIVNEFGKKGKGPGEFQNILSVYVKNNRITLFDSSKMKVINFSMDGKFIDEYSLENYRPISSYSAKSFAIVLSKEFYIKDKEPYIDYCLEVIKSLEKDRKKIYKYTVKYEPFKFDLNTSIPKFTANNSIIVYTNQNDNYFKLNVYNIKSKKAETIESDYGKGTYSDKEFSKLQKFFNETTEYLKKKYPNKMKYVKLKNERPIISGLSFRGNDLWIALGNSNIKQDFVIFDENFKFKERISTNLDKIKSFYWINDKEMVICYGNDEEYKVLKYELMEE